VTDREDRSCRGRTDFGADRPATIPSRSEPGARCCEKHQREPRQGQEHGGSAEARTRLHGRRKPITTELKSAKSLGILPDTLAADLDGNHEIHGAGCGHDGGDRATIDHHGLVLNGGEFRKSTSTFQFRSGAVGLHSRRANPIVAFSRRAVASLQELSGHGCFPQSGNKRLIGVTRHNVAHRHVSC
jgi:hypothetical protein